MERFAELYLALDRSNRTNDKLAALAAYFRAAPPEDAIWGVYILSGRKIGRTVSSTQLRQWAAEVSQFPEWLVQECYQVVGDLSETLSLLIPFEAPVSTPPPLHEIIEQRLQPLGKLPAEKQRELIVQTWRDLSPKQRFVFHKLISGNFRVGVSRQSLVLALARAAELEPAVVAHRLSGNWKPQARKMIEVFRPSTGDERLDETLPYPFMLAHALTDPPESLGALSDWQIEWKWDGIRAQILRRGGKSAIWSRGDELINGAFPELLQAAASLPNGTVIDGEIVAWDEQSHRPKTFATLQRRLNRKNVELSFWPDVLVNFIAFDLLELAGKDLRTEPLRARREALAELLKESPPASLIRWSEPVAADSWAALEVRMAESRGRGVEGVMLKRFDSPYLVGRPTGPWWKLKVNPYTVDAVLIAAQPGTGRRAGLLTDYTFGVWNDARTELLPVAKAYSGLTDAEIAEMDRFVRGHTVGRFGPVYTVEPSRVFELGFEAIQRSDRHKSGIAVRFPRILRQREDKKAADADTLATLNALLLSIEGAG
ncbi:MAG TPA: ATP-dependent DNA ligase [Tepidisphaeraceae bacterium]|jgi:DNA ligase-1|nr:ATP-dependent DNA ligase [Tepidisphaeraceae bacterium]